VGKERGWGREVEGGARESRCRLQPRAPTR